MESPARGAMSGEHGPRGELVMDEAFWDERYRSSSALWSGDPNPNLVAETAGLPPGAALDVGCGEGADAIWLAGRGWRVAAVDLSTVALGRGAARALEAGVGVADHIDWRHADLTAWVPPAAAYDLVSAQFMPLPERPRKALFARLAAAVAPDGTLLVVGRDSSDLKTTFPPPPRPELYFTSAEVAASLDGQEWDVVVSQARPRATVASDGRPVTLQDAVLRARRRRSADGAQDSTK